jgi:hypothetical protein
MLAAARGINRLSRHGISMYMVCPTGGGVELTVVTDVGRGRELMINAIEPPSCVAV